MDHTSPDYINTKRLNTIQAHLERLTIMQLALYSYHASTPHNKKIKLGEMDLSPEETRFFNKAVHASLQGLLVRLRKNGLIQIESNSLLSKQLSHALCAFDREVRLIQQNPFLTFSNIKALSQAEPDDGVRFIEEVYHYITVADNILFDIFKHRLPKDENAESINLSDLSLPRLPQQLFKELAKYPKLKRLNLSHNQLINLHPAISLLPALSELKLNNNPLKTLPGSLHALENLTVLRLKCTRLTHLPECLHALLVKTNNTHHKHLLGLPSTSKYKGSDLLSGKRKIGPTVPCLSPGSLSRNHFMPAFGYQRTGVNTLTEVCDHKALIKHEPTLSTKDSRLAKAGSTIACAKKVKYFKTRS